MNSVEPDALRVLISMRDFHHVCRCIEAAKKQDVASVEHEALLHSAVIFYARPFLDSSRRKQPRAGGRLNGFDLKAILGPDIALHGRLIKMRKQVIAHAEAEFFPASYISPPRSESNAVALATTVSRRWHIVNEQIDLDQFRRIAWNMMKACLNRSFDLGRERWRLQAGRYPAPKPPTPI
jgi:hypothetical protein